MNSSAIRKIALESPDIIWFVARASVLRGPFTTDQLKEQLKNRDISYLDFCWRQGFFEWRPIGSLEDFDQRARLRSLPHYPSVEVPSGPVSNTAPSNFTLPPVDGERGENRNATPANKNPKPQKVQISFSRSKRHSISIYEWGLAVIFSVVFAYFAADFALHEVSKNFARQMEMLSMGVPEKTGILAPGEAAMPPEAWQPLFSAPSFSDVVTEHAYADQALPLVPMPVQFEGIPEPQDDGSFEVSGFAVKAPVWKVPVWDATANGMDPVYVRSMKIRGHLGGRSPQSVEVYMPGDPQRF